MTLLADALGLAMKDLRIELRTRDSLAAGAALCAIALVMVGLAAGPDLVRLRALAPGLTWIALLYAAVAMADRLEQIDRRDDAFSALWLTLADRRSIYVGRALSLTVVLAALQIGLWVLAAGLLNVVAGPALLGLIPLSLLTSACAASVTATVSALVAASRQRALLLPVLLLPLLVPTLLAGVQASGALLDGRAAESVGWLVLLVAQTALFAGLGLLVYETAATPE